jgi:Putative transposase, YhgA-like/Domain of unknown function (DUF4351)
MADHDSLYHRLFDHPDMVAQLLREFVAGPWLDELDLAGMERLNAKFHAETGDRREGDMIWRIPRRDGGDTYLVLLLEFQSSPYRWMALRMLVYASLLWQQLVNEKGLPPDGKLPPILPVVLYNGDRRWAAPLALHDLVELPGDSPLWQWQPTMRYEVVDEGAFPEDDLVRRDALVALLFRLENSPDPEQLVVLADAVLAWFRLHPEFEALRAIFAALLGAILAPLAPGARVPEELLEVRNMLATRAETWKRQWLEEGEQKGRLEGEQKGRLEGRLEGEQKGRREGEAALLLRLLERRFGALPGWARDRVAAADTASLEEWGLRVLDACSLDDVWPIANGA